ncbi:MAG TPA: hypothetical protein PKX74_12560, partial [Leptospiraceae bacterium]|nr:hypothetical protein [Leptospiraceae bacterium]
NRRDQSTDIPKSGASEWELYDFGHGNVPILALPHTQSFPAPIGSLSRCIHFLPSPDRKAHSGTPRSSRVYPHGYPERSNRLPFPQKLETEVRSKPRSNRQI